MDKFEKTLLPSDSLDVDMWTWLARNFVTPSKKHSKRLSHAGFAITILHVGMQSVYPSIQCSCSLLRETTRVWLLQVALLAKIDKKQRTASDHQLFTL